MKSLRFFPLFCFLMLFVIQIFADENWNGFKTEHEKYYHFLEQTDIQNFTCFYTTDAYIKYITKVADSSYIYPLKLIWTREGKTYYILEPYPQTTDNKQRQKILEKIQMTKSQFQGFYLDWLNFLVASPFADIPDDAQIQSVEDTLEVTYASDGKKNVFVTKLFLPSGQLLKVIVDSGTEKIVDYPKYTEVENKWLCAGWDTQIYRGSEISSGMATRLEIRKIKNYWLPVRVDIIVQTADKPNEKYVSEIFLKGYVFNTPLKILPSPDQPGNSNKPE